MKHFWKNYHKWVGLFFTFFILVFCISGIILNHRSFFSACDVNRGWLPASYHYQDWNNGIAKGTLKLSDGEILLYGNAGVWHTDSCFSVFSSCNDGLKEGSDNRKISHMVEMPDGGVWCAGLYHLYRMDEAGQWQMHPVDESSERISDVYSRGDTLLVLTRSHLFESLPPYTAFVKHQLPAPEGYSPKVSLFRTVWMLHSGELFGLFGQLVVDAVALVIIVLCITGLLYTFLPKLIRRRKRRQKPVKSTGVVLKSSIKWHYRLGAWLIVLTLLLSVTGMCLRPPLMLPLVFTDVHPIPGSTMDSDNPWHDKLRSLRWDDQEHTWLLSTSAGFYRFADFKSAPVPIPQAPPVSPMGINTFCRDASGRWLVGSFSGMFRWDLAKGEVTDYFTGEPFHKTFGRPVADHAIAGFSDHLTAAPEVVFDYSAGACTMQGRLSLPEMPQALREQPLSLWNFALELHVGRCYQPFLGPLSELFVFLAGLTFTLVLLSGYIEHRRRKPKKRLK